MNAELAQATRHDVPGELFVDVAMFPAQADPMLEDHPLIATKAAVADPDTMYMHKAIQEPDSPEFKKGMNNI